MKMSLVRKIGDRQGGRFWVKKSNKYHDYYVSTPTAYKVVKQKDVQTKAREKPKWKKEAKG